MSLPGVCPACGAKFALEQALIDLEAREALVAAFTGWPDPFPRVVIKYLGLLSPRGRAIKFDRLTVLIKELVELIAKGHLTRGKNGVVDQRAVSVDLWAEGMRAALQAHEEGRLDLPLDGHNWLKGAVWQIAGKTTQQGTYLASVAPSSSVIPRRYGQTEIALMELEKLKQGGLHE